MRKSPARSRGCDLLALGLLFPNRLGHRVAAGLPEGLLHRPLSPRAYLLGHRSDTPSTRFGEQGRGKGQGFYAPALSLRYSSQAPSATILPSCCALPAGAFDPNVSKTGRGVPFRRTTLLRGWVNKGIKKGRGCLEPRPFLLPS